MSNAVAGQELIVVMKGGGIMDHPQQIETTCPDRSTLRAWEDMCNQVLHEVQDGAEMPATLVDSTAELAAMLRSWRSVRVHSLPKTSNALQRVS